MFLQIFGPFGMRMELMHMEDAGQLTFTFKANQIAFIITSVYTRCNALERLEL